MSGDILYLLIDLFVAGFGVYVIAQYIYMKTTHELRSNALFPRDLDVNRCKDKDGYIKYIGTRQLLYGIVAMICGIADIAKDTIDFYNAATSLIIMVIFLAVTIWYAFAIRKATRNFW